ncbi:MAG TPA: TIM barrel protein [Segeticoccus sp.]|uniref:TIM barrel protein n=1 Tax=Segeticoccus sp. TaxID=2706531 RepID=UPI002D80DF4D|nr:TIM barrel protein [Segeticoccus sp.]HET8598811.1 TIM barrel protein [Segeticoccus sp.]
MSVTPAPLTERIAGAPISWGVCEVPGWGWQYDPPTVLNEMREVGLAATEFGPDGFLPDAPQEKAKMLADHGLAAVGQFVPVVLHDPAHDPLPQVQAAIDGLIAANASTVILAAATGQEGYDARPVLDEAGWQVLLTNLDRLEEVARQQGLTATLHPHVGTMVETGAETARVLQGSRIGLCLDTGHLLVGGADPVAIAREHPARISHVHLKDVKAATAARVRAGEVAYAEAVAQDLYAPLGAGDVDVTAIVESLENSGYAGWYVLEQDTVLAGPPEGDRKRALDDVRTSVAYLRALAERGVHE